MDERRDPLIGDRVRLTRPTPADADAIAEWFADGAFLRAMDSAPAAPWDRERVNELLDGDLDDGESFVFAVRTVDGDELVGHVTLSGIQWSNGVGWAAVGIAPDQQSRGYGTGAMELLCSFAFDECALHRVQLTVFEYNRRAIDLYERLGFQREGTYREFLARDGRRYDMLLYGLLRDEWVGRHEAA